MTTATSGKPHSETVIAAFLVLAIGIFYRVWATTPDMHFDPAVYAQHAYNLKEGTFTLETDSWFAHRWTVFVPVAPLYALFGVGTWTTKAWPLLASALQLMLLLFIGWKRLGPWAAILGAGFLAFSPLDVIYSSVLNPDIIIALFMTGAAGFWIVSFEEGTRPSRLGLLLAGICFALAVVTRLFAGILVLFFVVHLIWTRPSWKDLWPFVAGGLLIGVPLLAAYAMQTGDPLYRLDVVGGRYSTTNKAEDASWWFYPNLLLHPRHTITGLGTHVLLLGAIGGLAFLNRRRLPFVLWGLPILLYLQFGSMSATEYIPILKRERFLLPLSVPLFLLAADTILEVGRRLRLFASSDSLALAPTRIQRVVLTGGLVLFLAAGFLVVRDERLRSDVRGQSFVQTATLIEAWPELPVYFDHWRTGYRVAYYLGFQEGSDFYRGADDSVRMGEPGSFGDSRLGYLKWFPEEAALPRCLVVLHEEALQKAAREDDVTQTYRASEIPAYAYEPPADWELLGNFDQFRVYMNP